MQQLKKFLCPTDFSERSLAALRYALDLARVQGGEVEILHVHHVPMHEADTSAPRTVADLPEALRTDLDRRLRMLEEKLDAKGAVLRMTLAVGAPHTAIVEAARKSHADMIVMGTGGHSGLARMLLGSVTDKVLRTADRPVLTVHGA